MPKGRQHKMVTKIDSTNQFLGGVCKLFSMFNLFLKG
jgi:hypothetical protein